MDSKAPGLSRDRVSFGRSPIALEASEVGTDKMQLLRGQPTSITETVERQDVAIILQLALSGAIDLTPDK